MDEAERCHEIAYISYGRLIARGSVDEVIAGAGLSTWRGEGEGLNAAAEALRRAPGVDTVAAFGAALHVSGSDRAALEQAIAPWDRPPMRWKAVSPTLEDVFIRLMKDARDNMQ